jgi:hypothetical protein
MTLEQAWLLSQLWYGNRLDVNFRRPTAAEASSIFERAGLRGPFWSL